MVEFALGAYQIRLPDPDILEPGLLGILKHVYRGINDDSY